MAELTLAGMSGDGRRLLLVDRSGAEFTLVVDDRLRAALRGERSRIGQLEIQMESTLRPRDIQTRIRSGESPESVAQAAQTTVERIMPFAAPVLAERAHVAERAQLSSVRRRSGDGARILGEAVAAQLRGINVDPDSVEWDAWRREDGRWTLTGSFSSSARSGVATFTYDARGSFVATEDEDARWLIGDLAPVASSSATSQARDEIAAARQRRLGVVPPEELPLGEDTIEMVGSEQTDAGTDEVSTVADRGHHAVPERPAASTDDTTEIPATTAAEPAADEPPRKPARRRGRASVPSWDEIMFGGGKGD